MKKIFNSFINLPKQSIVALIGLYQASLSPDHGWFKASFPHGYCKYYPSCSEYSKQAITKFGLIKGFYLSLLRILKCNPLTTPRVDLIPNQ